MSVMQKIREKFNEYKEEKTEQREQEEKLFKWKKKLENALSEHSTFRANVDEWDALYHGTHGVSNLPTTAMSDQTDKGTAQDARQVVNIVLQLIESQIDLDIPQPNILPMESDDEPAADTIEGMLRYKINNSDIERINDENERIVKKASICWYKVSWNPNIEKHTFTGDIEITNPHPKNVIPQPGVYKVQDMDYIFHIENRTIEYVARVYGKEYADILREEEAEYEFLEHAGEDEYRDYTRDNETNKVSVVECWYKDDEGDVGLLVWANDVILRDEPKFFYKRIEATDEKGNVKQEMIFEEEMTIVDEEGIEKTIKIPAYIPKRFPFVIQYNIPKDKSIYGKSDPEIIKDQQEAIKKVLSIQEEKIIKGTTKIFTNNPRIKSKITNAITEVIYDKDYKSGITVDVFDLKTSDNDYLQYFERMLQSAKDVLGIQDAWVGKAPSDIRSGKALQQLAQNAANRISTKVNGKRIAYKELYSIMVDFMLAFYEEKRPFRILGDNNKYVYGIFDRSQLIRQDAAGDHFFPEFDITIDTSEKMPHDKMYLMDQAIQMFERGAIEAIDLWSILEDIGYPKAGEIKERLITAQQQPMQTQDPRQMLEQLISQFPPEQQGQVIELIQSMNDDTLTELIQAPPEQQVKMLMEVLG